MPLLMILALASCALPQVTRRPAQTDYRLRVPQVVQPAPGLAARTLRLLPVRAAPGLEGVDMLYSPTPLQLMPYRDSRWLVPPAEMIDSALRGALARQAWVAAVEGGDAAGRTDASLRCRLDSLEHDVYARRVELGMRCEIYVGAAQDLGSSWSFEASRPVPVQDAAHYAQATQDLLDQAVVSLLRQTARTLARAPGSGPGSPKP
jgi:cholesterol transport system auxiliary component